MSEKEFEVINVIADGFRSNQRALSAHVGLSLGMTNLLVRRLVIKGFLRIKQLNRKKVEYLLTTRGLAEKAKKSVHYTLKTIESIGLIKKQLHDLLVPCLRSEYPNVLIVEKGDLADLVGEVLKQVAYDHTRITYSDRIASDYSSDTLIIDTSSKAPMHLRDSKNYIHLLSTLSKTLPRPGTYSKPENLVLTR